MKNQYFGDNRDLFKYDLVHTIIRARHAGLPSRFTFIPMLTKDEKRRKEGKPGTKNRELVSFLNACTESEKRNIRELEAFFKDKINIYRASDYFRPEMRNEYFKQIGEHLLQRSLILVDPDKRLENERSTEKHIRYSEVKDLYDRMDSRSILMVFQFIPREKREVYFRRIVIRLREEVGSSPMYISDNQIVFFLWTKAKSLQESLAKVVRDYTELYGLTWDVQ